MPDYSEIKELCLISGWYCCTLTPSFWHFTFSSGKLPREEKCCPACYVQLTLSRGYWPPMGSRYQFHHLPTHLNSYHKQSKPWQLADLLACHMNPEVICNYHSPTLEGFTWLYNATSPPAWQEVAAHVMVNCCAWRGQEEFVSLGHYPSPAL